MVRTPRHESAPKKLLAKQKIWTRRYRDGKKPWAPPEALKLLQPLLHRMSHGKCVFCEGTLGVTSHLEIEHYVAKSGRPELAFEWSNLFAACRVCNGAKGQQDHGGALLKPDHDEPEPHFSINSNNGELVATPHDPSRADRTIQLCDLQRGALCTKRLEVYDRVHRWARRAKASRKLTKALREEWERLADPRHEFKFVVRFALRQHGLVELAEEDRERFERRGASQVNL